MTDRFQASAALPKEQNLKRRLTVVNLMTKSQIFVLFRQRAPSPISCPVNVKTAVLSTRQQQFVACLPVKRDGLSFEPHSCNAEQCSSSGTMDFL